MLLISVRRDRYNGVDKVLLQSEQSCEEVPDNCTDAEQA